MESGEDKPLIIMRGEIKTPPMSAAARIEAGFLLRKLQQGEMLSLPRSRPMPTVGAKCHELRIPDENSTWRIIYRINDDSILILEVFSKKTTKTPTNVIDACQRRINIFDKKRGEL